MSTPVNQTRDPNAPINWRDDPNALKDFLKLSPNQQKVALANLQNNPTQMRKMWESNPREMEIIKTQYPQEFAAYEKRQAAEAAKIIKVNPADSADDTSNQVRVGAAGQARLAAAAAQSSGSGVFGLGGEGGDGFQPHVVKAQPTFGERMMSAASTAWHQLTSPKGTLVERIENAGGTVYQWGVGEAKRGVHYLERLPVVGGAVKTGVGVAKSIYHGAKYIAEGTYHAITHPIQSLRAASHVIHQGWNTASDRLHSLYSWAANGFQNPTPATATAAPKASTATPAHAAAAPAAHPPAAPAVAHTATNSVAAHAAPSPATRSAEVTSLAAYRGHRHGHHRSALPHGVPANYGYQPAMAAGPSAGTTQTAAAHQQQRPMRVGMATP